MRTPVIGTVPPSHLVLGPSLHSIQRMVSAQETRGMVAVRMNKMLKVSPPGPLSNNQNRDLIPLSTMVVLRSISNVYDLRERHHVSVKFFKLNLPKNEFVLPSQIISPSFLGSLSQWTASSFSSSPSQEPQHQLWVFLSHTSHSTSCHILLNLSSETIGLTWEPSLLLWTWSNMAPGDPARAYQSQTNKKRNRQRKEKPSIWENFHITLRFAFHWPKLNHMATASFGRDWKIWEVFFLAEFMSP